MASFNLIRWISGKLSERPVGATPDAGLPGQVLAKVSSADQDTQWISPPVTKTKVVSTTRTSTTLTVDPSLSGYNLTGGVYLVTARLKATYAAESTLNLNFSAVATGEYTAMTFVESGGQTISIASDNISGTTTSIPGLAGETMVIDLNLQISVSSAEILDFSWAPSVTNGITLQRASWVQVTNLSSVIHGKDITEFNTGFDGHVQPDLRRPLKTSDLAVQGPTFGDAIFIGDLGGNGASFNRVHFTAPVIVDRSNVSFTDCLFDRPVVAAKGGVHYPGMSLSWCTVWPQDVSDSNAECVDYESYTLYRCKLRGCSDAVHIEGGSQLQRITESFLRVTLQNPEDHNDVLQTVGGDGHVIIERCNISAIPEGTIVPTGSNGPNSIIQCSNFSSSSNFQLEFTDNYINPGAVVQALRFYDGSLTPNITYEATGNLVQRGPGAVIGRGSVNTTPLNQITWDNNRFTDTFEEIPLS